ncbi:MAG: amidophosphoribosyltransferase [Candidatus Iainarchaeum sp.]|jgi:amidophosphoribosyltransferase|nr:MAG: Glutamine--fructose-6-phosphate aminotransferase (isomerizing) [archaeon ADurb.Bin336]
MKEECGIAGAKLKKNAEIEIYRMLLQLQHRGQLSAGITTYQPNENLILKTRKKTGLVNTVFCAEHNAKFNAIMKNLESNRGIGHVRYATCGSDDETYAQPFEHLHGKKNRWFSLAFNGNIANYDKIKKDLEKQNYHLIRKTDTEAILLLIAKELKDNKTIPDALKKLSEKLDGAYNLAIINAEGTIIASRDPLGIKPLCYATNKEGEIAFASESVALENIGFENPIDIKAGEALVIEKDSYKVVQYTKSEKRAHCFFEWVYFAHPASTIEGKLVYDVRYNLGKELAKGEKEVVDEDTIVVSVPDSSTPAGHGFSEAINAPFQEGLIRNRYVGRTFIQSTNRGEKVKEKFMLIKQIFEGKKVFLVEDSIVRGTTLKNIVNYIKKYGNPKEIHVRVSSPKIIFPCYYGIDMSTRKELIGVNKSEEEIAKIIGANSVRYQTKEGLINAIKLNEKDLCLACINGKYPTKWGEKNSSEDKKVCII